MAIQKRSRLKGLWFHSKLFSNIVFVNINLAFWVRYRICGYMLCCCPMLLGWETIAVSSHKPVIQQLIDVQWHKYAILHIGVQFMTLAISNTRRLVKSSLRRFTNITEWVYLYKSFLFASLRIQFRSKTKMIFFTAKKNVFKFMLLA